MATSTAEQSVSTMSAVIGRRVRARRVKLGLSQRALAERCGMERASITRLEQGETGERGLTLDRLLRVSAALGIEPAALVRAEQGSRTAPRRSAARAVAAR